MEKSASLHSAASPRQHPDGAYRPDIDGLRAVSVLSVTLYHFGIGPFTGGFVGVDVFFVISGFLITSILYRDIKAGRFSLVDFYDRRFRRILPAMLFVLLVCLVAGYYLLLPGDYDSLGTSSAYSSIGAANFYFLWNTGYFDQEADLMPLLHMWSLGVEEQFYLLWPLALFAVASLSGSSRRAIAAFLILVIFVSFGAAVYTVARDPSVAFYMLHTRAWELGLGALLVFVPAISNRAIAEIAGVVGIALIAYAIFTLTTESPFPGFNALAPCIGAALVVWPKDHNTVMARVLSLRPAVFVGLTSYSMYLWHWPVLVFFRHYNGGEMPTTFQAMNLILVAFALACLTWRFIERPGRRARWSGPITIAAGLAVMIATGSAGYSVAMAKGLPDRLPDGVRNLGNMADTWDWECGALVKLKGLRKPACTFGAPWDKAKEKILLWGDSHAAHIAPVLEAAMQGSQASAILFHACAPAYGGSVHRFYPGRPASIQNCKDTYAEAIKFLQLNPDVNKVVLAASWVGKLNDLYVNETDERSVSHGKELLTKALVDLGKAIGAPNRQITVLGPTPIWETTNPIECAIAAQGGVLRLPCSEDRSTLSAPKFLDASSNEVDALIAAVKLMPNAGFIAPSQTMCDATRCVSYLNGEFLYRDRTHLRRNLKPETLGELAAMLDLKRAFADSPIQLASNQATMPSREDDDDKEGEWKCPRKVKLPHLGRSVCNFGAPWDKAAKKVFLWGDSHATHIAPAFEASLPEQGVSVVLLQGCAPAYGGNVHRKYDQQPGSVKKCKESYKDAVGFLQATPDINYVVLAASWIGKLNALYVNEDDKRSREIGQKLLTRGLVEVGAAIQAPGRKITVLGPTPIWPNGDDVECAILKAANREKSECARANTTLETKEFVETSKDETAALKAAVAEMPQTQLVMPIDSLCDANSCASIIDGEVIYKDRTHFSLKLHRDTLRKLGDSLDLRRLYDGG